MRKSRNDAMQAVAREFQPSRNRVRACADRSGPTARTCAFSRRPRNGPSPAIQRSDPAMLLRPIDGGRRTRDCGRERIAASAASTAMIDRDRGRASFVLPRLPAQAGPGADAAARRGKRFRSIRRHRLRRAGALALVRALRRVSCQSVRLPRSRRRGPIRPRSTRLRAEGRAVVYLYCNEVAQTGHDFHAPHVRAQPRNPRGFRRRDRLRPRSPAAGRARNAGRGRAHDPHRQATRWAGRA